MLRNEIRISTACPAPALAIAAMPSTALIRMMVSSATVEEA